MNMFNCSFSNVKFFEFTDISFVNFSFKLDAKKRNKSKKNKKNREDKEEIQKLKKKIKKLKKKKNLKKKEKKQENYQENVVSNQNLVLNSSNQGNLQNNQMNNVLVANKQTLETQQNQNAKPSYSTMDAFNPEVLKNMDNSTFILYSYLFGTLFFCGYKLSEYGKFESSFETLKNIFNLLFIIWGWYVIGFWKSISYVLFLSYSGFYYDIQKGKMVYEFKNFLITMGLKIVGGWICKDSLFWNSIVAFIICLGMSNLSKVAINQSVK